MSHPYHHSISSVKKHGGKWEDYIKDLETYRRGRSKY